MPSRIVTLFLVLTLFAAPFTAPRAEAAVSELDAFLRLVPAVGGAIGGFCLGSPLGFFGKAAGTFIGWEAGKLVGTFLSHTIGGVFYDSYPTQPSLIQRIFGGGSSYGYGYAYAPSSTPTSGNIGALRDAWLAKVKSYEDALKTGDTATKQARHAELETAEKAYFAAKGAAK